VTPPTGLLDKGAAVEEWADLRFFRPLGLRVVRRLAPTRITADQVTLASLAVGLLGGHFFLYRSWLLNAIGLLLLVGSDVLDSADGQLARLRGTSTRLGAVLDGLSDNARFLNLYAHLFARVVLAGGTPIPLALSVAIAAGLSHSFQASVADFIRKVYLTIVAGSGGIELPEDLTREVPAGRVARLELAIYRGYLARFPRLCPASAAIVRAIRRGASRPRLAADWERSQAGSVARTALFGQNIRFLLVAVTALVGWPMGFFWLTLGPINLATLAVLVLHERTAEGLAAVAGAIGALAPAESG
jgi:phosphatidylglycerophosphate synthase